MILIHVNLENGIEILGEKYIKINFNNFTKIIEVKNRIRNINMYNEDNNRYPNILLNKIFNAFEGESEIMMNIIIKKLQ